MRLARNLAELFSPCLRRTPKEHVQYAEPQARLDYYESLRKAGKPCWFIRHGYQGGIYTDICASPRAAWKAAYDGLLASIRKEAA